MGIVFIFILLYFTSQNSDTFFDNFQLPFSSSLEELNVPSARSQIFLFKQYQDTKFQVEILGKKYNAEISVDAPFDPTGSVMRG